MGYMPGVDLSVKATDSNSNWLCVPDIVCIHTIVGYAPAKAAHFSTRADGHIWQHRDTRSQSAANLNGNNHIIAIENEDFGAAFGKWSGSDVPAFTPQQIESIAQICAWAYNTHGIPLVACPDSKKGSKGIAYHRQGIDGNYSNGRVAGGEVWSSARGKVCPGDRRIAQIPLIIKRARQIAGLEGGEQDLPLNQNDLDAIENMIKFKILAGEWRFDNRNPVDMWRQTTGSAMTAAGAAKELASLTGQVKGLTEALAQLNKGQAVDLSKIQDAAKQGTLEALKNNIVNVQVDVTSKE